MKLDKQGKLRAELSPKSRNKDRCGTMKGRKAEQKTASQTEQSMFQLIEAEDSMSSKVKDHTMNKQTT